MSETPSEGMNAKPGASGSASSPSAPTMAGKMVIPDLSGLTVGQVLNIEAMSAVTTHAAATLQNIMSSQQSALGAAVKNMQVSLQNATNMAGMPKEKVPDVGVQLQNMSLISDQFGHVAETLTTSTTQTVHTLIKSVTASMAKIEEVAKKFSGG